MPFAYKVVPEQRVAYVTAQGPIDMRAAVEAMGELGRQPDFDPSFGVVIDLREMNYRPSLGELRVIAWALAHERFALPKRVAVVLSETVKRTRARVYDRFGRMAGLGLKLFPNMPEADAWAREEPKSQAGGDI
jgi:hypothetical protein